MNNSTIQQKKNIRKTWLLMSSFFIIVIIAGWGVANIFQNQMIFYGAIIFSLGANWFSYFFSDKIALKMSGAKEVVKNSEHQKAVQAVEKMANSAGIPMPKIYIIEDQAMNAFATGRNPEKASVAFTTGILQALEKEELEGVAAHELAHIKNRDILVMTIVVTLVGVIAIISDMAMRSIFFSKRENQNPIMYVVGIALIILSPIVAKIIQLAISRKREFLADASGAEISHQAKGLASALRKISTQSPPVRKAGTATAHLYIASPFGAKKEGGKINFMASLFSTHPPVEKRIKALEKMQ